MLRYDSVQRAVFLDRPNRFIARVVRNGREEICHVKNTGRCRELLVPGAVVWLTPGRNPGRKTAYDLIAVEKGARLINMDSQAPNPVFAAWAADGGVPGLTLLKKEQRFGDSRLDFYFEAQGRRIYAEVKGVTLEEDGAVFFPDAPTQRGVKHLTTLCDCIAQGFEAWVVFIIQMENVRYFSPNDRTDPAFGAALRAAAKAGVRILALECAVTPDSLRATRPVAIKFT